MAENEKTNIKLTDLIKNFDMKSKDVLDIFKELGIEKKTGATVSSDEFDLFVEHVTFSHQIKDMEAYSNGSVSVAVTKDEKANAKAESKVETEAGLKTETASEAPKEVKNTVKEEQEQEDIRHSPAQPKTGVNKENRGLGKGDMQKDVRAERVGDDRNSQFKPAQNHGTPSQGANNKFGKDKKNFERTPNHDNRGYGKYGDGQSAPFDPFAKRREQLNNRDRRNSEAYVQKAQQAGFEQKNQQSRPAVQDNKGTEATAAKSSSTLRPAEQMMLQKQAQAQAQKNSAQTQPQPQQKKEEKKPQKQQFRTIAPVIDKSKVKGGVNLDSTYTAEPQKTRIVDTRTSDVDLSKYDDHYNDQYFSVVNGNDTKASKQKLKKQDNRGTNTKSAKDKERLAQEKIKKMEAERARNKQLEITVPDEITVSELSSRLKKSSAEVIKKLMLMGEMKGVNDVVDFATAEIIADEFGAKVTKEVVVTIEEKLFTEAEDDISDLEERAPVVCVMGHVDHGKTSILDAIRHTNVTRGEAGGITQAIGAYRVKANGKDITFLDTPGHEAFTAMRMRGAKSTDIAILVVAADDGVMPQTIEAINHAKAAGVDVIVAINKMDKQHANPDNVLNQLTQYELVPEEWGGDVICVPVSAHTGMGIEDLLESILLVAEVKELKANPNRRAKGLVIESKLDRGRGPVATVLVQNGTLHQGDYVIVGNAVGRVRAMTDDKGKNIKSAGPSVPVEIVGLDDVPQAGDELNAVEDEKMARNLAEQRREKMRQEILNANARVNLDDLFTQIADGVKTLNIIVKADVAGSAEAVKASLLKLSCDEVKVNVIHSAVGGITESDVMLAAASNAIITGFNVRPDKNALDSAERNGVDIRTHRIIYEIIDEIEAAMKGLFAPTYKENLLGHAEVRQTIRVPNVGTIAGCYVRDGKITRQAQIRIVRDGIVIFEDKISSLRRFKDDVKEVNEGYECGVGLEKFNDIKEGDILEAFIMEEVKRV